MTKTTLPRKKARKAWFAPRQVYLRTGDSSDYVELSTSLQAGVAICFGLLALWLTGASYSAVSSVLDDKSSASIASQLAMTEAKLVAATEETEKIQTLEIELADARAAIAKAQQVDETAALSAELNQTRAQLEELRHQFSEAKAEEATLQAKLEAQAIPGDKPGDQPAEEASSLHAQLEDAFGEIENLEKMRDEAEAKVAALAAENAAKDESTNRNETMLKAATEEIERLQTKLVDAADASDEQLEEHKKAIDRLSSILAEEQSARKDLQERADLLTSELERRDNETAETDQLLVAADAEHHADVIAAGLHEAELLATIDRLRARIETEDDQGDDDVDALKAELALAETEIETILKNTLNETARGEGGGENVVAQTFAAAVPKPDESGEIKELKSELSSAKSDIIKLRSDVRVAKERLAEQADTQPTTAQQPDNSAKLEQQLASTRSRIQQLNKALADAKLREVAVDLALINVVPAPSPPAPR